MLRKLKIRIDQIQTWYQILHKNTTKLFDVTILNVFIKRAYFVVKYDLWNIELKKTPRKVKYLDVYGGKRTFAPNFKIDLPNPCRLR